MPDLAFDTPWCKGWRPELIGTLLFVVQGDQVLLIHKKTGHGLGKVNGPGGKLEPGEGILECALRETFEETGVQAIHPHCGAEMRFVEEDGEQWLGFGCVAREYEGEPKETREAKPFWCAISEIPYASMWPDDEIWLPPLLAHDGGEPLVGNFLFRDGVLLEYEFVNERSIWQDFS